MRNKQQSSYYLISYFSFAFPAGCEGVADATAERSPPEEGKKMDDPYQMCLKMPFGKCPPFCSSECVDGDEVCSEYSHADLKIYCAEETTGAKAVYCEACQGVA